MTTPRSFVPAVRRHVAVLVLAALALVSSLAAGQTNENAAVTRARQLYQQGVTAFDAQEYDKAERLLRESYQTHPHPVTLRNLAAALERLERRADACNELARLIRVHPTAEERANAERTLANLSERVGKLEITVSVTGADVKVDDKWVGVSPLPVWYVEAGEHSVSANKQGFKEATAQASVGANASQAVSLTLVATDAPGMPGAGLGTEDPGANGGTKPSKSLVPVYIAGGVAALGIIGAVVFEVSRASNKSDAEDARERIDPSGCGTGTTTPSECGELHDANVATNRAENFRNVSIGVAVVGAAVAVGYLLWPSDSKSSARGRTRTQAGKVRAAPFVGSSSGGFVLEGSF